MVTHSPQARRRLQRICRAVADPTRRAILDRLREGGEAPAGELARGFRVSRPAISKHLRLLRQASLVREQKRGRQRIYTLNPQPLADIDAWLANYRLFWTARLIDLKTFVESSSNAPRTHKENTE